MVAWTFLATWLYAESRRRSWLLLLADLALTLAALVSSLAVLATASIDAGDPTLTVSWAATPVLAWAVWRGPLAGLVAAVVIGIGDVVERQSLTQATTNGVVLLLLGGGVVGYVVQLARRAEGSLAQAVQREAAAAERERLARQVHDGVLQALALVNRTSSDPALAALAADQEASLRRLVSGPASPATGAMDLCALLPRRAAVELALPAQPVLLPLTLAQELAAAAGAAIDNALAHGGTRAWVLVEDELDAVTVSVRDDGPGIAAGRLADAARDGRMGVARSIRGRVADLGGTVSVVSTPGQGTEVELRVPKRP
ncbi:MAG: sensor histidine kinase [Frankiales bacterium]|jgi:signal transduction histidine kinase|nr:sensor histidine kinase [Frankiales bacterium]